MDNKDKISVGLELDISSFKKGIDKAEKVFGDLEKNMKPIKITPEENEINKKILEYQKKSKDLWDNEKEPFTGIKNGVVYIKDQIVGELIPAEEKAKEKAKELNDKLNESTKPMGLLEKLAHRIALSMRRQIITSVASMLNPLRQIQKLSSSILNIFGLSVSPLDNIKKIFDYLTNVLTPRLGATFKNIGENILEYFANSNVFQNLTHQLLYFVLVLQDTFNLVAKIFGWRQVDLFAKSTKTAKSLAKSMNQVVAGFDEINDIGQSGAGASSILDATPLSAEELFSQEELDKAMQKADKWAKKIESLKKFWDDNKEAIEAVGVTLGIVFGAAALGKLMGNINGLTGSLGKGAGLLGTLETLAGIGAIVFTIDILIKYIHDKQEFDNQVEEMRTAMDSVFQEQIGNEDNILELIEKQNEIRKSGIKDIDMANLLLFKITGNSEQLLKNAEQTVINSGTILKQEEKIYDANVLTREEKGLYLESLVDQYNANLDIIKQLEDQGSNTEHLKEIQSDYLYEIEQVGTDLGINTDKIYDMARGTQDSYKNMKQLELNTKDVKKAVENVADSDYEAEIKVGANVESFKSRLKNVFKGMGSTLFTAVFPTLGTLTNIISKIASLDVGTNYVPNDQLAMIHKGEAVIPKKFNDKEFFGGTSNDETNELLQILIERIDDIELNPYIRVKDIGEASINYINKKSRITGRSVI